MQRRSLHSTARRRTPCSSRVKPVECSDRRCDWVLNHGPGGGHGGTVLALFGMTFHSREWICPPSNDHDPLSRRIGDSLLPVTLTWEQRVWRGALVSKPEVAGSSPPCPVQS